MDWYEDEVKAAIAHRDSCLYEPKTIFYGSSSIRMWTSLYDDFKEYKPVNLGFGGSTLAACVWFFDRIVAPIKSAERLILYAGDNDLGDGRHPQEVLFFFREFNLKLREYYPQIPFFYISIKPSLSRNGLLEEIIQTNSLIDSEIKSSKRNDYYVDIYSKMVDESGQPIGSYFEQDGLHLNKEGYAIWKNVILKECLQNNPGLDQ
jgi:lysophospholipase L1-like esterase